MKINQKGHSMVEMLGVLAIIGVLSVGAIAGYSRVMIQHTKNSNLGAAVIYGDAYCSDSNECLKDFTLTEAEEFCDVCNDKDECIFFFQTKL